MRSFRVLVASLGGSNASSRVLTSAAIIALLSFASLKAAEAQQPAGAAPVGAAPPGAAPPTAPTAPTGTPDVARPTSTGESGVASGPGALTAEQVGSRAAA